MAREHRMGSREHRSERISRLAGAQVGTSRSYHGQVGLVHGVVVKEKLWNLWKQIRETLLEENFNSCFYSIGSILSTDLLTIPDGSEKKGITQKFKNPVNGPFRSVPKFCCLMSLTMGNKKENMWALSCHSRGWKIRQRQGESSQHFMLIVCPQK